jgi:PP-loop superfamily ATP-utilizing enzyme
VTADKLKVIDRIEESIRSLGFLDVRVRLYECSDSSLIGIVELDDPEKALDVWMRILDSSDIGLFLDPRGYRKGSMNQAPGP